MKPFDLKQALEGYPLVTAMDIPVTGFHRFDDVNGTYKNIAVVKGVPYWVDDNGKAGGINAEHCSLCMASIKKKAWVSLYRTDDGIVRLGYIYFNEPKHDDLPYETGYEPGEYISVATLEWEE